MPDVPPAPQSKSAVFVRRLGSTLALWGLIAASVWTGEPLLFFGLIVGLGALGLVEWRRMLGPTLDGCWRVWMYAMGAVYTGLVWWQSRDGQGGAPGLPEAIILPTLLFGLFAGTLRRPLEGRDTLWRIFAALAGFIYIPFLFSFAWRLLLIPGWTGTGPLPGVFYLLFVVAITKFTDMGAYVIGVSFGRHKMIPHISPGKTWEGLVGAFLGAFLAAHGMVALFGQHIPLIDHAHAAGLAICLGAVTVVADLAESVVKRCLDAKDSGHLLPGIGGALDLIDSLLFTCPAAWLYFHFVAAR
jgi:phosphatidate cytidylyltransferase